VVKSLADEVLVACCVVLCCVVLCCVVLLLCCCCVQVWRIFKSSPRVFIVGSLCDLVRPSATASCILELERVASAQTSVR